MTKLNGIGTREVPAEQWINMLPNRIFLSMISKSLLKNYGIFCILLSSNG